MNVNGISSIFNAHSQDNLATLDKCIRIQQPDAIINCIGYLVEDSNKNPAEAVYLNSYFPHLLENMTKETNTKVIHISTDCIFDGKDEKPYTESSLPTATNYYGRSKALGELNNEKDLTLRQSIIGPAPQTNNTGLFNWIYTTTSTEVEGWTNVMWNGITTLELAKQIEGILVVCPSLHGIVNLVPPTIINKCDLLKLIVDTFDLPVKVKEVCNRHFSFKVLKNERKEVPIIKSDYNKQLAELRAYMDEHNLTVGTVK